MEFLVRHPEPFAPGSTRLVAEDEPHFAPAPALEIRTMRAAEEARERTVRESAWLLLAGDVELSAAGVRARVRRDSLFEDGPVVLHVAAEQEVHLRAHEAAEFAVVRASNPRAFPPRLFAPEDCVRERRGAGLVQGACEREVRTIFDRSSRPESALVLGEVVTFPGRWSSYPPHAHPQLEVYHYRFDQPQGYGHAECGEHVYRVRSRDTLKIPGGATHAQVAAPGYAMWYLWAVRHLAGAPYEGFRTEPEHEWLLDPARQGWSPRS